MTRRRSFTIKCRRLEEQEELPPPVLPDEVVEKVMEFLLPNELFNLRRVSWQFNEALAQFFHHKSTLNGYWDLALWQTHQRETALVATLSASPNISSIINGW